MVCFFRFTVYIHFITFIVCENVLFSVNTPRQYCATTLLCHQLPNFVPFINRAPVCRQNIVKSGDILRWQSPHQIFGGRGVPPGFTHIKPTDCLIDCTAELQVRCLVVILRFSSARLIASILVSSAFVAARLLH